MSAKWRALQHRHRYTYSAVLFPQSYIETLNLSPSEGSPSDFFTELNGLILLNSTYSQVAAVKKVASAFSGLLSNAEINDAVVPLAARLYLEILFLEDSLPLHRTLISVLAKSHGFRDLIGRSLKSLCDEYGRKEKRFVVSRAALSLLSYPKLGFLLETIEECAVSVAVDAASGLRAVVSEISNGSRPSPVVMEQCQEAMSCLYYLLQKFPSKFVDPEGCWDCSIPKDSNIFGVVVREILNVLKSSAFSRDCLVAAGVSFCAALQVCLSPQELAIFILEGLFRRAGCSYRMCTEDGFVDLGSMLPLKEDLYSEIREFSILSRLCLLRGVLTAVPRTVLNICFTESAIGLKDSDICESGNSLIWTILFNGILPELCSFCENPIDSHFNFHALTVTQICLQQIKTSLLAKLTNLSGHYNPFPGDMVGRILRIIWNNLEDPLNQTVKQVHLIFDLFLDIQYSLKSLEGGDKIRSFLQKTALDLLRLGARCKGRYVPLSCLTKRLGAKTILDMCPRLLYETTHAYIDDDVCCSATSFLKCFLECLRDECWSTEGIEKGYIVFRGLCLPPLLNSLVSGLPKLRSNLNTYALPVVLEVDVDSIFPMLAFISVGQSGEESAVVYPELVGANMDLMVDQRVAALVSLLKVSRSLALIEGDINWYCSSLVSLEENNLHGRSQHDFAFVCLKGINVNIPVDWLVLALTHVDDALRIDAAESLFLNPKTASLPSPLELSLLKEAVPLNMRCCSMAFQMKWTSMFRKFFSRVRTALERQVKQGCWQPLTQSERNEGGIENDSKKLLVQRAEDLFSFMKWLSSFLLFSCYPSAPYERKTMAMELILILINVWPLVPLPVDNALSVSPTSFLYPYSDGFILPDSTLSLVCSIIDSWDRLRESSFHILLHFPTPLPGISSDDAVKEVIAWAKQLVCSPRVRESDAGALTLRLIFRKYVLELGWIIGTSVDIVCFQPQSSLTNGNSRVHRLRSPVIEYVLSLVDWLRVLVEDGEKDLSEACKNSFVHGVLLALRYTFEELNWDSDVVLSSSSEMRRALEKLLDLVMRITSLALWVVSADAWHLPEDIDDMDGDGVFMSDVPLETDSFDLLSELQVKTPKLADSVRPTEQIVMVGCWLAMKEVSLLLATIIRKIPLPSATCLGPSEHPDPLHEDTNAHPTTTANAMLDFKQLETTGRHFVEVLLKMKHNGAIDKTRAGFTALCNRLLCSNDPRLCKMTESWMEQLMERTVAKGQTVDDLLRRSAGIPAAFIALFLSEPEGTPKKLLPWALRWLIDVAKTSLPGPLEVDKQNGDLSCKSSSRTLDQASSCALSTTMDVHERMSKTRDEGVIPTVHAFNVLRAAFNDTNLAADTSGFSAEALIISIRSFSSPYWEVRNSACLAYTALVRRMIGFLNMQKRELARRALTGLEFFHRYPALHPFLFGELKIATESFGDGNLQQNMAKVVHPSLCPILILLSRLKPSAISSETADSLDPFVFWPFITRCATQSNLRVRILASRALTGLVSNEKLQTVLKIIACRLPHGRNEMATVEANSLMLSSLLKLSNSVESEIPHLVSFNAIHGTLLQICALLDNNCRNLTDVSKKDQILRDLIETLVKCSWIGGPKSCPCPTLNNSYLRVLDLIICIARTCGNGRQIATIRNLLQELSSQCLDADTSCRMAFYDPTEVELRRQAATSYFNCIFTASPEAPEEGLALQAYSQPASSLSSMPHAGCSVIVLQERLRFCLSEASYEIRLATLKWLLQFLKSSESDGKNYQSGYGAGVIHMWAKTALQPTLMHLLAIEENPKCSYHILRIIFSWNSLQYQKQGNVQDGDTIYIGRMDCDAVFHFWDKLISLNKVATHVKSQEALIRCMGLCVKRFANFYTNLVVLNHPNVGGHSATDSSALIGLERWPDIYECIVCFIGFIKQNSASFMPVNKRKAAAESIVASGLLEEAASICSLISNCQTSSETLYAFEDNKKIVHFEPTNAVSLYAHQILDLWFICIKLLEDEDIGLRQRLAMDIQTFVDSKGSTRNHAADIVPAQVETVIELSFEFLTSIFGHWVEYFNYLSRWVFEMASYTAANGDLVRQVFDKEIDNHHEERLLICQICCFHMQKLSLSKSLAVVSSENGPNKCDFVIFLHEWRMRFLHQLMSFANDYIETEGRVSWIGGIGNHKDAFVSIYANLLGLYALSHGPIISGGDSQVEIDVHRPLLSGLTELRGIIVPFLRNPLIYNLYSFVIQSYRKMLGIALAPPDTKSQGDCSSWEGFDPYFLSMHWFLVMAASGPHGLEIQFPSCQVCCMPYSRF